MTRSQPTIRATDFESPLALLSYLLEQDDIPITELLLWPVIEQYLDLMNDLTEMDMELASQFLLMAATLLQIKSQAWLPNTADGGRDESLDALHELELKLLAYRRCKLLSQQLQARHEQYGFSTWRLPLAPAELGIEETFIADRPDRARFDRAVDALLQRNRARFQDLRGSVRYLLQRERVSVKAKMKDVVAALAKKATQWFADLFPADRSVTERIAGFLAVLELTHQNRIVVKQNGLFAPIKLRLKKGQGDVELQ